MIMVPTTLEAQTILPAGTTLVMVAIVEKMIAKDPNH
jgi:hypothetical protein